MNPFSNILLDGQGHNLKINLPSNDVGFMLQTNK